MGEGSSFPVTRPVRLLLQAGRWGGRDSSISGTGIPGLREREALRDCVGEAELVLCKAGGLQACTPAHSHSLSLSSSPGHCGDPGGVVTSSLFISFSHSPGSQGKKKEGQIQTTA